VDFTAKKRRVHPRPVGPKARVLRLVLTLLARELGPFLRLGQKSLEAAVEEAFAPGRAEAWARVQHFLLGNNIACDGDSGTGAHALARLMADGNAEIETWYIAGNSIGPNDMGVIARALENNVHARALWLKRNPLGEAGAAHLGRLLAKNHGLCLLDIHNTGLFDEGVEALVRAFDEVDGVLHLRHLYASANAISERGVKAFFALLAKRLPAVSSLVSLSLSLNRLGNRGCDAIAALVETGAVARLERLDLGSIGLESPDLSKLVHALIEHCPKLRSFDLGTYLSTRDIGEKANLLHPNVTPLAWLLREHPALELLDVSRCGLAQDATDRLAAELRPHQSLHGAGRQALRHTERERRFLKHPKRVLHIDSIYRGRA
jgi:Ran GTPase-activating protein (RanGAP) involved in mRNA processing and transport